MTGARRTNSELEAQVAALRAANAELEAFSYSVSHDLRAPLRWVDGYAKLLAARYADALGAGGQEYVAKLRAATQQMGQLIDGLLEFSRLQRQPLDRRPTDLTRLFAAAWADLAQERDGRDIEFRLAPLPAAAADPGLLRHVVINLLSNAIKYTRDSQPARIEVGSTRTGDGATAYLVRDNGTGFDMRYAGKLFGVFQRLHRAEEYEGTGIGLALAARIVRRHGGRIWADAAPGQGATFSFTLGAGRDTS